MLTSGQFVSPLGNLLHQLKTDGHEVSGCLAEYTAMREVIQNLHADFEGIQKRIDEAVSRVCLTAKLYRVPG
jgi:hypothetical protein